MNPPILNFSRCSGLIESLAANCYTLMAVAKVDSRSMSLPVRPGEQVIVAETYEVLKVDGQPAQLVGTRRLTHSVGDLPYSAEDLFQILMLELPASIRKVYRITEIEALREIEQSHFMWALHESGLAAAGVEPLRLSYFDEVRDLYSNFRHHRNSGCRTHLDLIKV